MEAIENPYAGKTAGPDPLETLKKEKQALEEKVEEVESKNEDLTREVQFVSEESAQKQVVQQREIATLKEEQKELLKAKSKLEEV